MRPSLIVSGLLALAATGAAEGSAGLLVAGTLALVAAALAAPAALAVFRQPPARPSRLRVF